jgi:RNA methyltransferase, TrmH family
MRLSRAEIDEYRALRRKEGRAAAGQFLLEGWRALAAALAADAPIVSIAVRTEELERAELAPLKKRGVPVGTLGERDLGRISATEHSQGVVARVRMPCHDLGELSAPGDRLLLALDAVSDPGNLGTLIRTADWFGATGVLLGAGCVDPFNEKVVRATAGSLFHLPLVAELDLPAVLRVAKSAGFQISIADMSGSVNLPDWRPAKRNVIVLGSEAHGVSDGVRGVADLAVAIPRIGRAESLNVAVAAGIILNYVPRN